MPANEANQKERRDRLAVLVIGINRVSPHRVPGASNISAFPPFQPLMILVRYRPAKAPTRLIVPAEAERTKGLFMFTRISVLSLLALIAVIATGCVTNGRRVLLKEYGPSVSVVASNSLKGTTIYLKGFDSVPDLIALELKTKPEKIDGFKYMDFTRDQDKQWDKEWRALAKQKPSETKIGNMRNGFGMVMSHVYALNDPAAWLIEGLKYDLEAQGAKVVDASQAAGADVALGGTVQLCRVDMYMTVNASLVVALDVQPKAGAARNKQIHTHGATAAMMASEGEYLHALRDARQKFSILATREIAQALKPAQ